MLLQSFKDIIKLFKIKIMSTKKTLNHYLQVDGHIAFYLAIYNRCSDIGDRVYTEICGGFIEGVHQWATHNIEDTIRDEQRGLIIWTIRFTNGSERRFSIPDCMGDYLMNDWKHAKNFINKFLKPF